MTAMNFARTHRSSIAWMLFAFVLFSGVVCGLGHGKVLNSFSGVSGPVLATDDVCGDVAGNSHQMSDAGKGDHGRIMQLAMFDCAFAGKMTVALVFFIALGWLSSSRDVTARAPLVLWRNPARHASPGCIAQAP